MTFDATVERDVLQVRQPETRWLSTGWDGGFERADVAYNVTVPEGWNRTDLSSYLDERRVEAGFDGDGPALLTGVEMQHARGARAGPVVAYATVGVSNPAVLPMTPTGETATTTETTDEDVPDIAGTRQSEDPSEDSPDVCGNIGTVNLIVGTTCALDDGALANLVAVAVEAKTATLLSVAGFPGTTTDAVIVGSKVDGGQTTFSGSATPVGAAARACVRDAVRASFRSRYATRGVPRSLEDAEHGVVTDRRAEVFTP